MAQDLLQAIRKNDYKEVDSFLTTEEGKAALNQSIVLNAEDQDRLQRKISPSSLYKVQDLSKPCPVLYLPIIYGNFDIFDLLLRSKADEKDTNQAGISLKSYALGAGHYFRFLMFALEGHAVRMLPTNAFQIQDHDGALYAVSPHTPLYDELECLVDAASAGALEHLNRCIENNVDKIDTLGTALKVALLQGHESIVKRLKEIGVEITNRHYFAAGLGLKAVAFNLFAIIRPDEYTRNPSPVNSLALYHALYKGEVLNAYQILREDKDLLIEPRHFYATGQARHSSSTATASRLYDLISYAKKANDRDNRILPNFLTEKETQELEGIKKTNPILSI